MASTIRYFNLVLSCKGNKYKRLIKKINKKIKVKK